MAACGQGLNPGINRDTSQDLSLAIWAIAILIAPATVPVAPIGRAITAPVDLETIIPIDVLGTFRLEPPAARAGTIARSTSATSESATR
ncbi:hypothetical protein CA51_47680 [Rosistilla oblonga]|nr:hypothetical protein CA51_47680 [Rosistilla oblonga]